MASPAPPAAAAPGTTPPPLRERLGRWRDKHMMSLTLGAMVFGLLFVYFSPLVLVTIPAGHRGVMWYRFGSGTHLDGSLSEGTRVKFPWDVVYRYDARLQLVTQDIDAITKDGLTVKVSIAVRFRVTPDQIGALHKNVGPNYVNVMLMPELASSARVLIANYTAEEFYTVYRLKVQSEIHRQLIERLLVENSYSSANQVLLLLDEVMIKSIQLPDRVAAAIERKLEQYQQNLEYDFRLQTEAKEAQRKQIEGEGVRAMFDRIGPAEVDEYLRLAGIQATLALAQSPNSKVVVMGSGGTGGLPLVLGDFGAAPQAAPGASAPSAQAGPARPGTSVRPTLPPVGGSVVPPSFGPPPPGAAPAR
jgi:regulator of protease activity HflC (stomatin/prohibitin superfamily)